MYLVFPPEYSGLADATYTQALGEYQYTTKHPRYEGLVDKLGLDYLVVTTYDLDKARAEQDVAEYRWSILKAMAQGAVFVHFEDIEEAHFFTPDEETPLEDQIAKILVAGKYAEGRAEYYQKVSPKAVYVGSSYVSPLAVVVTPYNAKGDGFERAYNDKVANVLASLPEDLWAKTAFATSRMSATIHKLLDELPDSAIVTLDKKTTDKVESYEHTQFAAPKNIDVQFGIKFNNTVKRKEVEEKE